MITTLYVFWSMLADGEVFSEGSIGILKYVATIEAVLEISILILVVACSSITVIFKH